MRFFAFDSFEGLPTDIDSNEMKRNITTFIKGSTLA